MRLKFGVGIGPPNVLVAPKPVSSDIMSRIFGAPFGAVTPVGKSGLDSLALRPTMPPNGSSGTGRTGEPPVGDLGDGACCANTGAANNATTASVVIDPTVIAILLVYEASHCWTLETPSGQQLTYHIVGLKMEMRRTLPLV